MNKLYIGFVTFSLIAFCSLIFVFYNQQLTKTNATSNTSSTSSKINYDNSKITLERTACFGYCPVYSVSVDSAGNVIYNGQANVKLKGLHEASISKEKYRELVDEFYRIGYFGFYDNYTQLVSDLPTTITSITINGKTKQVKNYSSPPKGLKELENKIDEITTAQIWIGQCVSQNCESDNY